MRGTCNRTFLRVRRRVPSAGLRTGGFTLVEVMVALGILAARWSMASVLILFAAGAVLLHFVDEEKGREQAAML